MYQDFSIIYDNKIKEDFDYEVMAGFVRAIMKEHSLQAGSLLDMGSGTGNAGHVLRKEFSELILCDSSAEMLTLAREKFTPPYLPQFILGEAEGFRMPGRFDLVLSVLDIPNYLTEEGLISYFENSHASLKERGLLIFDVSSPFKLYEMAATGTYIFDEDDYFYVWENHIEENRLKIEINFFIKSEETRSLYRRITEEQYMQIITKDEIIRKARSTGFKVAGIYDGYSAEPLKEDSQRMVFVLKKGD